MSRWVAEWSSPSEARLELYKKHLLHPQKRAAQTHLKPAKGTHVDTLCLWTDTLRLTACNFCPAGIQRPRTNGSVDPLSCL